MKRKLSVTIFAVFLLMIGVTGIGIKVKAYADYTGTELKLTKGNDIDVYNSNYVINTLYINNVLTDHQEGIQVYKFTLEQDGFVKLMLSARGVKKTIYTYSPRYTITEAEAKLTASVYRDEKLLYEVMPSVTAQGDWINGESKQKIALDKGTYYIAIRTDKYNDKSTNKSNSVTEVIGDASFIIYYQMVESNEVFRPSSVGMENPIKFEEVYPGLLTASNPKDYYTFNLEDKALVKLNFMYDSTKNAKFILYGRDREILMSKQFVGNSEWNNIEKFLEPGKYYCSIETLTSNDGGRTSLLINPTIYPLKLDQKNSTTNSHITVETIDIPKEVRYVKGKMNNSELNSAKWKSGKVITEELLFGVNMTGYYTVRVTDEYGNMFMQSIKVDRCDSKAPAKPTIKSYKADSFEVTGTAEKNAIVTVTYNKKVYTCTASSKGNYSCVLSTKLIKGSKVEVIAQDISGNTSEKAVVTAK